MVIQITIFGFEMILDVMGEQVFGKVFGLDFFM